MPVAATASYKISWYGILALLGLACLFPSSLSAKPADNPDRSSYGTTDLPFWSELTDFEIMALKGVEKARQGDPDSLFALAIFASGDVRDMATYSKYRNRLRMFVASVRPKITGQKSDFDRGKTLYDEMCGMFFKHRLMSDELKGYDCNQSRLSMIFSTGKFNCVSSSLLYIILARYFGMKVQGVNIPSHAFVQLETDQGKTIEIETTSRSGYNLKHDPKSYSELNKAWFDKRGLQMPTYNDYSNRQLLDPFSMVVHNMTNQHTAPDRMTERDRNRLCEAMGYCFPNDKSFEYNRLVTYNNESLHLHNAGDDATSLRFFKKIMPTVETVKKENGADTAFFTIITLLELEYGYVLSKASNRDTATEYLCNVVSRLSPNVKNYPLILNNIIAITQAMLEKDLRDSMFEASIARTDRFSSIKDLQTGMRSLKVYCLQKWASYFWAHKNWKGAIEKFGLALNYAEKKEVKNTIVDNVKAAFFNYAVEQYNAGRKGEAATLLKQCKSEFGLGSDAEKLLVKTGR
jgi:hypothetical protein